MYRQSRRQSSQICCLDPGGTAGVEQIPRRLLRQCEQAVEISANEIGEPALPQLSEASGLPVLDRVAMQCLTRGAISGTLIGDDLIRHHARPFSTSQSGLPKWCSTFRIASTVSLASASP